LNLQFYIYREDEIRRIKIRKINIKYNKNLNGYCETEFKALDSFEENER